MSTPVVGAIALGAIVATLLLEECVKLMTSNSRGKKVVGVIAALAIIAIVSAVILTATH